MSDRTALDDAARWFLQLQEPAAKAEVFLEWQRWLATAPEHRKAFDEIEETILRLSKVDARPALPSALELAEDSYDGTVPISEFLNASSLRSRPDRERFGAMKMALAAGIATLALLGGRLFLDARHAALHDTFAYHTAPGEQRTFKLPDGSRIRLDADSVLNVAFTPERRSLTLARGEAYFEVSKDATRPFVVSAGGRQVRAVGTAFNVRMSADRTTVAVVEGKVEVTSLDVLAVHSPKLPNPSPSPVSPRSPSDGEGPDVRKGYGSKDARSGDASTQLITQVAAGEAVAYAENGIVQTLPAAEASLATAWLNGRRQYRNEPLRYVLADVDRHTGQRIEVADATVGELKFTGTLNLENSDAWLKGLSVALPVSIAKQGDGTLSVQRRQAP